MSIYLEYCEKSCQFQAAQTYITNWIRTLKKNHAKNHIEMQVNINISKSGFMYRQVEFLNSSIIFTWSNIVWMRLFFYAKQPYFIFSSPGLL
jgi:hypothetical protein